MILEDVETGGATHRGVLAAKRGAVRAQVPGIFRPIAAAGLAQRRTVRPRCDEHPLSGFRPAKPAQRAGAGMNWLALSPIEVAGVWAGLAALALWLYLHHRRPQHRKVSTLRFWVSVQPISQPRRRKLREPWALLAQVLFLAAAHSRAGQSAVGLHVRGPQCGDRFRCFNLVAGSVPREELPGSIGNASEALRLVNSLPAWRSRAAASRGSRCAADPALHDGSRGAAPCDCKCATFQQPRRRAPCAGNGQGGALLVRGRDFWFTLAPECWMRSRTRPR